MAKIALVESKPSRNDYVRLFNNEIHFGYFSMSEIESKLLNQQ